MYSMHFVLLLEYQHFFQLLEHYYYRHFLKTVYSNTAEQEIELGRAIYAATLNLDGAGNEQEK